MGGLLFSPWSTRVTRMILAVVMLAAGIGIGAGAMVVAQDDNNTFYGCLTRGGGLVKVQLNTAPNCSADQPLVSRNQQGPVGPAGPPGPAGTTAIQVVSEDVVIPAQSSPGSNYRANTADCPAGTVATGGGYLGDFQFNVDWNFPHVQSGTPVGWTVGAFNEGNTDATLTTYVLCASSG